MKLLFIQNVGRVVDSFSLCNILAAKELGIEFHIASSWTGYSREEDRLNDEQKYGIKIHQIDFIRTPYNPKNIRAYRQVVELIKREGIDAIHCSTPIGGVVGRLAGKKCGVKILIYQAHGFHFFKNASIVNWMIYYPIEKMLANFTDVLITINDEDFCLAKSKLHLRGTGRYYFVPGVGIDLDKFIKDDSIKNHKREELHLDDDAVMVISSGDLIKRKNYKTAIEAIAHAKNPRIHYFICGKGPERQKLEIYAKELGIETQVHFMGFRTDMRELYQAADIFLFTTLQEGLPRSLMEAMATGLPCIASDIRGNCDLLTEECGYLINKIDSKEYAKAINILSENIDVRQSMGHACEKRICNYDVDTVRNCICDIYKKELLHGQNDC